MEQDMTKGKPSTLLIKFMIPLVIGNIFQQLYNMVDTIVVGRYIGVEALAAVGATGTIMFLISGFMIGLTTGFTVLTAQRFGAGDEEGVRRSVGNAAVLSIIITAVMTTVSVVSMDGLLRMMNTPEDILADARSYILIICFGMCFWVLYNLASSVLRALGNSKMPLYSLIVAAVLNIVLDLLLVIVIPLGVAGAAIATIFSQAVSGVICVVYLIRKVPVLALRREHWKLDPECVKHQLSIGVPMALQFSITAVGTMLVQSALNLFGSTAVAAYTAALKVQQLVTQPYMAVGMTVATYSAQNRGVNDTMRIRKGVRIANWLSLVYSVAVFGILLLIFPAVIRLFVGGADYEKVLEYANIYIVACGSCFVPLGMIFVFRNVMQGCGHSFMPAMGGVVELLCRMAAAWAAVKTMNFMLICVADAGTWLVTGIFLAIAYLSVFKKFYPKDQKPEAFPAETLEISDVSSHSDE